MVDIKIIKVWDQETDEIIDMEIDEYVLAAIEAAETEWEKKLLEKKIKIFVNGTETISYAK